MTFSQHLTKHTIVLSGLLIGLPLLSFAASADPIAQVPSSQPAASDTITLPTGATVQMSQIKVASTPPAAQNPCPSIYYENPYDQYVVVPQTCRPNSITQQLDQMGMLQSIRSTGNTNMTGTPATEAPYTTPPATP